MCNYCKPPQGRGKTASYPYAADGCAVLAELLLGEHGAPEKRRADAIEAIEHVQGFLNFEVLDEHGQITAGQIRHQVVVALQIYCSKTDRNGARTSEQLVSVAQELVDMLETCRESMENRTPLDLNQAKEFAKRFRVLGEQIKLLRD